jgi:hypothetical protein
MDDETSRGFQDRPPYSSSSATAKELHEVSQLDESIGHYQTIATLELVYELSHLLSEGKDPNNQTVKLQLPATRSVMTPFYSEQRENSHKYTYGTFCHKFVSVSLCSVVTVILSDSTQSSRSSLVIVYPFTDSNPPSWEGTIQEKGDFLIRTQSLQNYHNRITDSRILKINHKILN